MNYAIEKLQEELNLLVDESRFAKGVELDDTNERIKCISDALSTIGAKEVVDNILVKKIENLELRLERKQSHILLLNDEIVILKKTMESLSKVKMITLTQDAKYLSGWQDGIAYEKNTNDCEYCGRMNTNKCKK